MNNPGNYPLNDEQKTILLETIEEIGIENLHLALTHAQVHTNSHCLPEEQRTDIYKFLHGCFLICHQEN